METAWLWGDALELSGDHAGAEVQWARVRKEGARSDPRTLAQFLTARGEQTEQAIALLQKEREGRDDLYTRDALAFALLRAGKVAEARPLSDQAVALGTPDARLLFHAGAIRLDGADFLVAQPGGADELGRDRVGQVHAAALEEVGVGVEGCRRADEIAIRGVDAQGTHEVELLLGDDVHRHRDDAQRGCRGDEPTYELLRRGVVRGGREKVRVEGHRRSAHELQGAHGYEVSGEVLYADRDRADLEQLAEVVVARISTGQ